MNIVVRWNDQEFEAAIDLNEAAITVGELCTSLVGVGVAEIVVNGRCVDDTVPVAELSLADGSTLEMADAVGARQNAAGCEAPRQGVFNRPPRAVSLYQPAELVPPRPPQDPGKPMRFGWGALIVPLLLGLGMAVFIHPRMAVFALFSPAMLLANWMEDKRRVRRERREFGEEFAASLRRFRRSVAGAHEAEVLHRRSRATSPTLLEERSSRVDSRLWERRLTHDDFMTVPIGSGCVPWTPPALAPLSREAADALVHFADLHDVPIQVTLAPGDVAGFAGDRPLILGMVRHLLLQAGVHHGPADLSLSIFTERAADWDWAKWLPHLAVDGAGRRRIAATPAEVEAVVSLLPGSEPGKPHRHFVVVDLPDLAAGPRALLREVLQDGERRGVTAVAIARRAIDLPSLATTIVSARPTQSYVRFPDGTGLAINPWKMNSASSRRTARALARIQDPEAAVAGTDLPTVVHLETLLGIGGNPVKTIVANWRRPVQHPATPIGAGGDGSLVVDLVADGPHALLGGTTGAGKSELLRTLVAGLAASVSPEALNFVLVDYKGGSAFDACSGLPHTVGLVTDLDDHLARRALLCLEAELRYREQRLRVAGVSDIDSYVAADSSPLPRLLVVVDEFAALAMELPDFMDALVGIAQRGRSLGVHLLLATQRPNGVISENIKANTNLRIALRMQDAADSVDVIGSADAAGITRSRPGRGLARRGPGDVVAFQTALVTGRSLSTADAGVSAVPFVFAHEQLDRVTPSVGDEVTPTDLEVIVAATNKAAIELGLGSARLPWPNALPSVVTLDDLGGEGGTDHPVAFALADEPNRQRRVPVVWSPGSGNLLIYGLPGSGTTTALASIAVSVAANATADQVHMHVLDFDDQLLASLRGLPHVGSVVAGADRERQLRLLRRLGAELQQRRNSLASKPGDAATSPTIVTMLDNFGGFADSFGEPGDMAVHNLLARLVADGPGVGMMTIITAKQPGDIPSRVASLVAERLVFRLADRYDYSGLGVPPIDPPENPGRAFESGTGREVQVALPHPEGLDGAVASHNSEPHRIAPWKIDVLPCEVSIADFISAGRITHEEWYLPLGIGDSSLVPVGLVLRDGEHALITGPARSGKSTALATTARVARAAHPDLRIAAVVPRRSELSRCLAVDEILAVDQIDTLEFGDEEWLLLVDDAELIEAGAPIGALLKRRQPLVRIVAAGSADALKGLYGHWTQELRRSRIGCALRPNTVSDGDLWQTQLPRNHTQPFPTGRGYLLADGQAELIQLGRG